MKKYHKIHIEKKITKYIINKEIKKIKNKSQSPSLTTSTDSPKSYDNRKTKKTPKYSGFKDSNDIFIPIEKESFFFQSKNNIRINKNHIISNIKQNHFFTMKLGKNNSTLNSSLFKSNRKSNSLVKIKIKNNLSNMDETYNIDENNFNKNKSNNLFNSNAIINPDINDNFLHSISDSSSNSNSSTNIKNNKKNKTKYHHKYEDIDPYTYYDLNEINKLSEKQKVIILALIHLNKDHINNICKKEEESEEEEEMDLISLEEFSSTFYENNKINIKSSKSFEEYLKKIYLFVDNRIGKYYKYFKDSYGCEPNIKTFNLKYKNFNNIGFKSIVMSLISLIADLLSDINLKYHRKKFSNKGKNINIFIDLITKYNKIKKICPLIENDFYDFIKLFEKENNMKISLNALFTDFYWDYIFKIFHLNHIFINAYISNDLKKNISYLESMNSMNKIIDILSSCEFPYKKKIGTLLNIQYIEKENIFLMDYILKYKKNIDISLIHNILNERKDENLDGNLNENKTTNEKLKKNDNGKPETENGGDKEEKDDMDNNETNTENFSLEEVYNYIQNNNDEPKNKKKYRRHKRKKKNEEKLNKNKNNINSQFKNDNEDIHQVYDPVVEEFKKYFNDYNTINLNLNCIKIKPKISQKWIESIS